MKHFIGQDASIYNLVYIVVWRLVGMRHLMGQMLVSYNLVQLFVVLDQGPVGMRHLMGYNASIL